MELDPPPLVRRLGRLTPDQRAAAVAPPGPVLCVAPAGSGKTTTVVARIVWRIVRGTPASSICAMTFNRRAADELQGRVDAALEELGDGDAGRAATDRRVRVKTFHALGREILADAGVDVTRIVERADVLARIIDGPVEADLARQLDDAITRLKLDPEAAQEGLGADPWMVAVFEAYQAELARNGTLDLDDLVARTVPTLRADGALLARWRGRCATLFVDEAQDLDRAQLELVLVLAGEQRDVFLVGDDDQTIYAWRLADVRRILGLASRLPGLVRVDLATNHRCPPEVVHRAARLVEHNVERFEKDIGASPRAAGELILAPDPGDDVARARRLLTTWGPTAVLPAPPAASTTAGATFAILARTNRELAPYAAVALERGMAHRIDEDVLLLDDEAVTLILDGARRHPLGHMPLLAVRDAAAAIDAPPAITTAMLAWSAGYADVSSLAQAVEAAQAAAAALRTDDAALSLATVHGTKGLEWDHVACVGYDEGRFPSARTLTEGPDPRRALEEERRLGYVAWTRARRSLTIVYDPFAPSIFLREAFDPDELATATVRPSAPVGATVAA